MNSQRISLAGSLDFLSLTDLMQLLGTNGNSGVLRLTNPYASAPGLIKFSQGNPINASYESLTGLEALFSFFGWMEGEFMFAEQQVDEDDLINKSRMEIILDGLRMLDDGQTKKLGPVSFSEDSSAAKTPSIPVVKGPFIDYLHVVDEEAFSDGENIVVEGKHGSWIWVILEGVIEIIKETPEGKLSLVRLGEGSFIGNIAFLLGDNVRSATIVAVGDVQLGVMDSQSLSAEFMGRSFEFREMVTSFVKRLKHVTDTAVDIYFDRHSQDRLLENQKPLIHEGKSDEGLSIIENGEATVVKTQDGQTLPVARLYKGDYIGCVPFLNMSHEPYSASIYTSKNFKMKPVEQERLQHEYGQLSTTFKNIIENLVTCISVTTQIACEYQKKRL